MEEKTALAALAALAHETRLAVFRLLVAQGPSGLPAGEIAERIGVVASTLSFHLKELDRAGLLRSWRRQRQIFYAANYEGTRGLLTFLTRDCCHGHPEICGDLARLAPFPNPRRSVRERAHGRNHDLPQPGLWHVAQRPGPDPQQRVEPRIIEYLKSPPSRTELVDLIPAWASLSRSPAPQGHALRRARAR